MSTIEKPSAESVSDNSSHRQSLVDAIAPLDRLAVGSANLLAKPIGEFDHNGERYVIPRYIHLGPRGGDAPTRIGIFAGIHGDEVEGVLALVRFVQLLESQPELSAGYCLFLYPVCNPTGFEDKTRHSRDGLDLNRQFWVNSNAPEVRLLQSELVSHAFDGIISLHSDDTSDGLYGFVRGATLTKHLLRPALAAASELLPLNQNSTIDAFPASEGVIHDCFPGILSAPPKVRPKPFEIILETPRQAPQYLQEYALVIALRTILLEYRKFISYAANL